MARRSKKYMNPDELPEVLRAEDIQSFLDIGRVQAYELIKTEQFRSVKIGRSIRISKKGFLKWFEGTEAS
ncbi:helix-turn-helix domain-containing protein [Paenibacillus oryzisoli]|uniref:helix-turn-helix domain-containing protein n=1 Tax=Paenibacillus oryzisoli TaxID=1850517 RepID=UPI003D2C7FD8